MDEQDYGRARSVVQLALDLKRDDYALVNASRLERLTGNVTDAVDFAVQAFKFRPSAITRSALLAASRMTGDPEDVIWAEELMSGRGSDVPEPRTRLLRYLAAKAHYNAENYDVAEVVLMELLAEAPWFEAENLLQNVRWKDRTRSR
jgi:hypothetical protein